MLYFTIKVSYFTRLVVLSSTLSQRYLTFMIRDWSQTSSDLNSNHQCLNNLLYLDIFLVFSSNISLHSTIFEAIFSILTFSAYKIAFILKTT